MTQLPNCAAPRRPAPWFDMDTLENFPGTHVTHRLGTLTLSQAAAARHSVHRDTPLRDVVEQQYFLLILQRRGAGTLEQRGRTMALGVGDMVLHEAWQPYRLGYDMPFEVTVARIPAAAMRTLCPLVDTLLGTVQNCRQPQVALLAAMADCHAGAAYAELPEAAALHAAEALRQTLAGCALAALAAGQQRHPRLSQYHLGRIRQFALRRIGDSGLSINELVEALDISAAHIHRLFAAEAQSFSTWLWETRLQLCHLALRNPEYRSQSISQIAYRFGYSHAAHFSRAYRKQFGMTPSAWRAGAAAALVANTATASATATAAEK